MEVPAFKFLMLNGAGDPNDSTRTFRPAVEALFTVSYTLKFMLKKEQGVDYGVLPLEGLWCDDMADFNPERRDDVALDPDDPAAGAGHQQPGAAGPGAGGQKEKAWPRSTG